MIYRIAWRYFIGKKSTQAIQLISWVSVLAMAIGTASLILVLSVFNGFEFFIKDLYSSFYPDIKINSIHSNKFPYNPIVIQDIRNLNGIEFVSATLEEKILLLFEENQCIVTLKGVDSMYDSVTHFNNNIQYGVSNFDSINHFPTISIGLGVSNNLGANEETVLPIQCYSFKKNASFSLDPTGVYNNELMMINSVFQIQNDLDNEYSFCTLETLQLLTENEHQISNIEIKLKPNAKEKEVIEQLEKIIAPHGLKSVNRYEQNKVLFFILKSERWAVYAILTLMLIIASFNIVGSLSMLVIDKEKDISILKTMGMQNHQIRKIFIATGVFISISGAIVGCVIAFILTLAQLQFGFVKLSGDGNYLVDAYPIKPMVFDYLLVIFTVVLISMIASWGPAARACHKPIELKSN
ncbi:MAG: ABC transporter permease [Chitinophagaceae bacterium]|nr:MAG: lipoprotein release ABC transporter permease [Bacteroidetes bacterium OLB11]MCC6447536.1 ABC transporter permease [Chitinophagaceae bacterium]HMN32253.1 FtsX-like permease family protein [Chitinophagaceae bacterium]